jgi:3-hydroxy acid dehydrogenase / malonic semialdehyde reductase
MSLTSLKGKWAIVTGATAGIGLAIAQYFAQAGIHLILTARRREKLLLIKDQLEADYSVKVRIFDFDISNKSSCLAFNDQISEISVDILVNNAGLGLGLDLVHEANIDDWEQMIDTNIKGLLYLSRMISPGMVQRKSGHILNIGSIAGHQAYRGGAVYCATKYAVNAINTSMKMDLHGTGVRVSMISPGMVNTEFSLTRFHGDQERAHAVYAGMTPLSSEDIADIALFVVSRPPHVNIMDVIVLPTDQSSTYMVHRENS